MKTYSICLMMMVVLAPTVEATVTVVHTAFTPSNLTRDPFGSGSQLDWGWRFTTNQAIQINAVGYYDSDADGLRAAHEIGIWRGFGARFDNPLASATVGAGLIGEYIDGFRYINLDTPMRLDPGDYIVSGSGGNDFDGLPADRANTVLGEGIVRWDTVATTIILNTRLWTGVGGTPNPPRDGSNFRYVIIPEPSAPALFAVAMFILTLRRDGQSHRRRIG